MDTSQDDKTPAKMTHLPYTSITHKQINSCVHDYRKMSNNILH